MRLLVLFLIGIAIGAVCTAYFVNAMNRRSAYPDGVMTVMGQQMKSLGESIKQNRCTPSDLTTQLQTVRLLANNIEPAFDSMRSDGQFGRYASGLRAAADTALTTPLASCALAGAAVDKVDQACDRCHRDYRQ
jgi:cytochrome c556